MGGRACVIVLRCGHARVVRGWAQFEMVDEIIVDLQLKQKMWIAIRDWEQKTAMAVETPFKVRSAARAARARR